MIFASICVFLLTAITGVFAESHQVQFVNRCGSGTPKLIQGPNTLSTGGTYTSNGPLISAIAYLDNGKCLFNGEGCTTAELTLKNANPSAPGSGSSVDITLIPPHKFSQAMTLKYINGCDSTSVSCPNANCPNAFRKPDDTTVQRACQSNNVGLQIQFC